MVSFLITDDNLEYHILGYNVIQELVQSFNPLTDIPAVQASFGDLDKTVLLDIIKLIQDTKAERLCTMKILQVTVLTMNT